MAFMIDRDPCDGSPRLGSMVLDPTPESVARARRWFRKLIAPYEPACSVDDCVLLISELVTNAILYGQSDEEWVVRVEWSRKGSSLHVEVHNPGFPASVRLRRPDTDDAHGRGLLLVDSSPPLGTPGRAASAERSSPSSWPTPGLHAVPRDEGEPHPGPLLLMSKEDVKGPGP